MAPSAISANGHDDFKNSKEVFHPLVLPPKVDKAKFTDFARKVVGIVGRDNFNIITATDVARHDADDADVDFGSSCHTHDFYRSFDIDDDNSLPKEPETGLKLMGSALVHPRSAQDVQSIVQLCNEYIVPIWPISTGRNLAYGGSAPRVPGSLVMVMGTHMNRILEVDVDSCTCIVEPGVTFMMLSDYLKEKGITDRVRVDSSVLGWGSMIGNALDRGGGASLYGDRWGSHSGMEVIMPTGELVRMGMGAVQDPKGRKQAEQGVHPADQAINTAFPLFMYGWGPINNGLFSQGNNGIVTKMGFWLMPTPKGITPFSVTLEKEADLAALVDVIHPLVLDGTLQSSVSLRNLPLEAGHYGPRSSWTNASLNEVIPEEDFDKMAKKLETGRWLYMGAVYGSNKVRESIVEEIKAAMAKIPGSRWVTLDERPDEQALLRIRTTELQGIASMEEFAWMTKWLPNCSVIMIAAISRFDGKSVWEQYSLAKKYFAEAGIDYMSHYVSYFRTFHNVCLITYDRKHPDMPKRAAWLARTLVKVWKENGWTVFRTHVGLMDQVADMFDFNDGALWKLHEKIHNKLDPNGILAPGKSGVWPEGYDKSQWVMGKEYM
ncbi:hypothetical protein N0V82_003587 [Gnomoniopsis sp. IMI 355080]|nr:hypothetical protein N0V82_003587 [Gnomoniopsis sp. IMI 355080]